MKKRKNFFYLGQFFKLVCSGNTGTNGWVGFGVGTLMSFKDQFNIVPGIAPELIPQSAVLWFPS